MSPEHGLTISGMASDYSHLEGSVVLVTGHGFGKSDRRSAGCDVPEGVHVEGDVFRRFIVSGRCEMTPEPSGEALAQLRLRYRLTAEIAEHYVRRDTPLSSKT